MAISNDAPVPLLALRIDCFHHVESGSVDQTLEFILTQLAALRRQGDDLMSVADDMKQELIAANLTTTEIAADLDDLLSKLAAGGLSPSEAADVKAQIIVLKDRLTGVAAKHTPAPPAP